MRRADLLLEIGSEEIPAAYLPAAVEAFGRRVGGWLSASGVDFDPAALEVFATPRRLAVLARGVGLEQPIRSQVRLGPAVTAAFDAEGRPTKAAEGFARSVGLEVDALEREQTEKGERLAAHVRTGGASLRDLLLAEGVLGELIDVGFAKTMRWLPGRDLRYARPIRWVVCLLDDEVVPLALGPLRAGRVSRGHRTLHGSAVEIPCAGDYEPMLESAHVIVSPSRRRERIHAEARRLAAEQGGRLHEADDLLEEVTYLVEHPQPVLGRFDAALVDRLPPEVIVTAMRSHQRYFSVETEQGRLLPCFITFRDGGERSLENVIEGNERVLRARLDDACFYWDSDRGLDSDAKLEQLARIVWLEGLGSIAEKCDRIASLAQGLADDLSLGVDRALLRRGALLSKTDLATEMIRDGKEFTELQGTIGRYYALEAGELPEVADVIREHLHPRFAGDRLPEGEAATLVALADRLDSIAGCTLAGFAPTGGQDPYALRRQALAVLRILQDHGWHLDLERWTRTSLAPFPAAELEPSEALERITDLFWGRLETVLSDLPAEIVRAVLSVSGLDPVENLRAARDLATMRGSAPFARLVEGAKRCRNILVKEDRLPEEALEDATRARTLRAEASRRWERWTEHVASGAVMSFEASRFEDEAERALHEAVVVRVGRLEQARAAEDHAGAFAALAELGDPIDRYFGEVLVNASDPDLRANRLAFLEDVHYLFARFADLSRAGALVDG